MPPRDVCAVIYSDPADPCLIETAHAVLAQPDRPAALLIPEGTQPLEATGAPIPITTFAPTPGETRFAAGIRAGAFTSARWLWLLDGRAIPQPGALAELLGAAEALGEPAPLLLCSKVLDEHGRLHVDATPRHEIFEKQRSVDAAERHLVHLRLATHGSVLIAAEVSRRFAPPRSGLPDGLDIREWSARLMRSWADAGYLVPASVTVRRTPPAPFSWRRWAAGARLLGSSGWTPTEKLWEGFLLGEEAGAAIRRSRLRGAPAWVRQASSRHVVRGE